MVILAILILLRSSAVCADIVDLTNFTIKLLQLTDGQLGVKPFQARIDDQRNTNLTFLKSLPNGQLLAEQISRDIDEKVSVYIDAVRRIQTAYNGGQIRNEIRLDLCCNLPGLVYDPLFMQAVDATTMCHLTQPAMSIDQAVKNVMVDNLKQLPNTKWQYYGTEDRLHCTYPARNQCTQSQIFDPRIRPWYTATLNSPRDIVILMDRSTSMGDPFNLTITDTKFSVAKKAAASLVQYLNANDRVAFLAFSDTILSTNSTSCFSTELAVGTDANKNQLLDLISRLSVDSRAVRAMFRVAFNNAAQLFRTTDINTASGLYADSEKIIVLLTDGNQKEDCAQIRQLEMTLFNNTVNIFTMGIGTNTQTDSQKVACLKNLTAGPRGAQGFVPYSSDYSNLRSQLGFYYNAFLDQIDRTNVTFSPPFTDISGLGLGTAACLPLFLSDGNVAGVTCVQIAVDEIFREVVNFRVGQLSYGFVIDRKGRVILHRLLPQPTYWLDQPTLLELTEVEISDYASAIEAQILSGQPGNMTVNNVRYYAAVGQSDLQGVTKYVTGATYYWHAIPSMNFYLGLVIIQNELNSSVTWNTASNDFLLSDELDLKGTDGSCVFFNRSSFTSQSVVKLAPMAFQDPDNYAKITVSQGDIDQLKLYMTFKGVQSPNLIINDGVRDVVAATTSLLASMWLQNTSDVDQRQNILSRYIGTEKGVYRRFPAVRITKNFDPTLQPWYKTASVQPNQISFTLPFLDYASSVPTISISKVLWSRRGANPSSTDPIMGVMGMDVTAKYLYRLLVDTIGQCKASGQECFAIDVSGFLVIHEDFETTLPTGSLHIAAREQAIAYELIQNSILTADACINYAALPLTKRLFWKTDVSFSSCQQLTTCIICKLNFGTDVATNLFLVVKLPAANSGPANCVCQNQTDGNYRCAYDLTSSINQCQCPCNLSVNYDNCLMDLNIDQVTWEPCIPSATLLNQADVTSDKSLTSTPSCLNCSSFTDPQLCEVNNCHWINIGATCSSTSNATAGTDSTRTTSSSTITSTATTTAGTVNTRTIDTSPFSPIPDNSISSGSSNSLTLGLAIGIPVGLVVMATVVGLVLFCRRRRRHPVPSVNTYSDIYKATGGYVTTIVVKDGAHPPTISNTSEEYLEMEENGGFHQLQKFPTSNA